MSHKKILIIVPCFNEELRLKVDEFNNYASENLQILFANDGSNDNTLDLISKTASSNPFIHYYSNSINLGKAAVVRNAYLHSISSLSAFDYYGYWDADLATPLWEIENMFIYANLYEQKFNAIFGSRVQKLGSNIERSPLRHILGRIFATIVSILLK